MATSKRGVDVLFYANTGSDASPVWTLVGGQRGATLSEESETVETTHKNSNGAKEYEYGFYGWSISAEGLFINDDAGILALRNAMRNKQKIKVQVKEGTYVQTGQALVTSFEQDAPHDGEQTFSVECQGTGVLSAAE